MKRLGKVYLVGAGPGDPGLMTRKGEALIRKAEVIIYDALVNQDLLDLSTEAVKIFAGKSGSRNSLRPEESAGKLQSRINRLLVRYAKLGKQVVRLKGGDPFIFGRGGEEASFLKKAGIDFEVIPGVSAGYAVPAYAGIPVTDRRYASFVTFVTAHEDPEKKENAVDWPSLAKLGGTIIAFMGVRNLSNVAESLIKAGKSSSTPVSIIERGTLPDQRVINGTLSTIAVKAARAGIGSPALAVIGDVSRLRDSVSWFESRPLFGKTILLTRPENQSAELRASLEDLGAQVLEFHSIAFMPPVSWKKTDEVIRRFPDFEWVIFTSVNGVESFFKRLREKGKDSRIFYGKKIAVIGKVTAHALEAEGLRADLVPKPFTSKALFEALKKMPLRRKKVLLARTDIAPAFLREGLKSLGAEVTELAVYRTVPCRDPKEKKALENWLKAGKISAVTFTSASTVDNFFKAFPESLRKKIKVPMITIGPVTSQALRGWGTEPYSEAKEQTYQGIVAALIKNKAGL